MTQTTPIHITKALALKELRTVIDAEPRGDETILGGSCLYVVDNPEAGGLVGQCLVGKLFLRLGVDPTVFTGRFETAIGSQSLNSHALRATATRRALKPHVTMTEAAYRALVAAQCVQDDGQTWGEAFEAAKKA